VCVHEFELTYRYFMYLVFLAFVVFVLFLPYCTSQEIVYEEKLQNDLFSVE